MTALFDKFQLYFQYPFVWYALIVGVLIALCYLTAWRNLGIKKILFHW